MKRAREILSVRGFLESAGPAEKSRRTKKIAAMFFLGAMAKCCYDYEHVTAMYYIM